MASRFAIAASGSSRTTEKFLKRASRAAFSAALAPIFIAAKYSPNFIFGFPEFSAGYQRLILISRSP
jgi:hypothetical protein